MHDCAVLGRLDIGIAVIVAESADADPKIVVIARGSPARAIRSSTLINGTLLRDFDRLVIVIADGDDFTKFLAPMI